MKQFHERKRPSKGVLHLPDRPTIILDTVCMKGKTSWLACDLVHNMLRDVWLAADAWLVGRYVIMPDHIHFCVTPNLEATTYDNWTKYWKSQFTKAFKKAHDGQPPPARWQENCWHRRLRNNESFEEKWRYIRMNPVRLGLVSKPEDWPYQGAIIQISWD